MKYFFRGLLIIQYDIERGDLKVTENFNQCKFIGEDFLLLRNFFDVIYRLKKGEKVPENEIKDIKVY